MRVAAFLLAFPGLFTGMPCATAQDWDLYVTGTITDAVTGSPIPFAEVDSFDELEPTAKGVSVAGARGEFEREFYTGAMSAGGYHVIEFRAPGYQGRTAIIDVTEVRKPTQNTAWRVTMPVALMPIAAGVPAMGEVLGYCSFHGGSGTLRWSTDRARKAFPIERYIEPRIQAHMHVVDSLLRLPGLMVDGRVREQWEGWAIAGALVRVETKDRPPVELRTDGFGYYATSLALGRTYTMSFEKEGFVTKRLTLDLTGVPERMNDAGFRTLVDIRLFAPMEGEDLSFLNDSMGVLRYDAGAENMAWDMTVSAPVLRRLNDILERHQPGRAR